MNEELKPCPYCGGEAYLNECPNCGELNMEVYHKEGCWMREYEGEYDIPANEKEQYIATWNRRAAVELDDFFYLPKPRQQLCSITSGLSFDDVGMKATGTIGACAFVDAILEWQEEMLNEKIVKRICEVWNPERTCRNVDEEYPYFKCSECGCEAVVGYHGSDSGLPNFCPNCGAKVVKE